MRQSLGTFLRRLGGLAADWPVAAILLSLIAAVTIWPVYQNRPPIRSDGVGYHLWTYAILDGTLDFDRYGHLPQARDAFVRTSSGGTLNIYPPGQALLRLPLMLPWAAGRPAPRQIDGGEHVACLVAGAAALVAAGAFTLAALRLLGVSRALAQAALAFIVLGAGLLHAGTYEASFTHATSAAGMAYFAWLWARIGARPDLSVPVLATALVAAFLLLVRTTNGIALGILGPALLVRLRAAGRAPAAAMRELAPLAGGAAAAILALGMLQAAASGRFTLDSYGPYRFQFQRPMADAVLFSVERGLFIYFPVLALALGAGLWRRETRTAALACALLVLLYAHLYGYWFSWTLGAGLGHRGFVELTPFMAVLFGAALQSAPPAARRNLLELGAVATWVALRLLWSYWQDTFPIAYARTDDYLESLLVLHPVFGAVALAAVAGIAVAALRPEVPGGARPDPDSGPPTPRRATVNVPPKDPSTDGPTRPPLQD